MAINRFKSMADRLDIIVFGATGFTGKFILRRVYKLVKADGLTLTWGIAGRSEEKLKRVLLETAKRIGVDNLSYIPIVIADVTDEESIKKMTARARIIINCCGPYQIYGEVVVKACIETGTHHLDVSAESLFMESIEEKYHKAAEEKGVYIVNACGLDSIPADLGLIFLEKNFEGTLNSMEFFGYSYNEGTGTFANFGTWESGVGYVGNFRQLFALRKSRNLQPMPKMQPKLPFRYLLLKANIDGKGDKWIIPLNISDRDVVARSQRYFYEHNNQRPVQMNSYLLVESFINVLKLLFFGALFIILAQFRFGRDLLLKYPELFSAGCVSKKPPPEDQLDCIKFSFTLYGEGWSEKLAEGTDQYQAPPNKRIVAQITGTDPGYGFTSLAASLSAIVILTETKKMPSTGGVYTPAVAFSKTSLIEQFEKNGFAYKMVDFGK